MRRDTDQRAANGGVLRRPSTGGAAPGRVAALAAGTLYGGVLLFLPWLPAGVRLAAAAAAGAAAVLAWPPVNGRAAPELTRAIGIPLHLTTLATGGLESPILVTFVPWLAVVARPFPLRGKVVSGGLLAAALVVTDAWARAGIDPAGAVEAVAVAACAVAIGDGLSRARRRAAAYERELSTIRDEAASGRPAAATAEAARRVDELGRCLDRIRASLGAEGVVLWDVDPAGERARPSLARGGPAPTSVRLRGDPLGWAWEEGLPLRTDRAPGWAGDGTRACVVPLERGGGRAALLTLMFGAEGELPDDDALEAVASELRTLVQLQRQEALTVAVRARFERMTEVLRRIPRETSLESLAQEVAAAGVDMVGGTGAAVALWENEVGRVLAVVGADGGPEVGAVFEPLESEMALAARHATPLVRDRRSGEARAFPVAVPGERWLAEPASVVVVPLRDLRQGVVGVLAVWSPEPAALGEEAAGVLELLAPFAAVQLQQTRVYGSLREHAERDALTGLHNRRAFEEKFEVEMAKYGRYGRPLSLVLLDVDHFKRTNDTHGHEAGDAVLQAVARCIESSIREVDFAARYGGEEFVIVLPETGLAGARQTAERLRRLVEESPVDWRGKRIAVRVSLGASSVPECVADPRALVESADRALYASKAAGRNRVTAAPVGVDPGPDFA